MKDRENSIWHTPIGLTGWQLLGVAAIIVWLWSDCSSNRTGREARLSAPGVVTIPVAKSRADLDAIARAGTAVGGNVFRVSVDTKVTVLHGGFGATEVQIADGPLVGRSGWVPAEWVK